MAIVEIKKTFEAQCKRCRTFMSYEATDAFETDRVIPIPGSTDHMKVRRAAIKCVKCEEIVFVTI